MVISFLTAMVATLSFSILYSTPRRHLFACAITGAVGWIIYSVLTALDFQVMTATFCAAFVLAFLSRIFAVAMQAPITIYLIPGIFPIVPGAGIYYTAYYFFLNNFGRSASYGQETAKMALAIAFGIIFAMSIPQKFFKIFKRR